MATSYPKGSEWRKWDLHVHTPASYDWDKKSKATNKDVVDAAVKSGLSAIAVTDHHSAKSVDEIKTLGKQKGLFVIPGVELRTDKGNEEIHIIGLFDPAISGKTIYDKLLCPLGFSEDDVKDKTNEQVYCNFKDACEKIHSLGGLVFLHAGNKANGIEQLDSDVRSTLKTDLACLVDLFEVNSIKNSQDYWKIVFPKIKHSFPCVITSDSVGRKGGHSTEYTGKAFTWIKADLSFAGLKQVLCEPIDRVCLDPEPTQFSSLGENPKKYLERITIKHLAHESPAWFDDDIELNQEMVAIIGRKGSGKSALVDIIALCGKSHVPTNHYSFLKSQKFRKHNVGAKKYEAQIKWLNKEISSMNLADEVDTATEIELVKYLPQSYVEQICNEDGVSKLFQEEINKVIFSYVPIGKRLGTLTLQELIRKRSEVIDTNISRLRNEIASANKEIVALEAKATPTYREKIEKELSEKESEYKSIKDPGVVEKPSSKLSSVEEEKLKKVEDSLVVVDKEIIAAEATQAAISNELEFISRLEGRLSAIEQSGIKLLADLDQEAKTYGVELNEVFKISIKKKLIETKKTALEKERVKIDKKLSKACEDPKISLYAKKTQVELEKENITKLFDEQNRKYQKFLDSKQKAEKARGLIMGQKGDKGLKTIQSLKDELNYLESSLKVEITNKNSTRKDLTKNLFQTITGRIALYKEIYQPLLDFIEKEKLGQEQSGNELTFDAGVEFNKAIFSDNFLEFINQGKNGSFQSKDAGIKKLKELLAKFDLNADSDITQLTEEILHNLRFDTTANPEKENAPEKQINQGYDIVDVYNFLHQLSYVNIQFKILFNGKDLNENEFSPGEKGTLLLIFYLLIDNDKIPLIMDQPEENLDNESVYSLLVPYIKRAKKRRQIIIVTHNPNLAIVCDAEQIICATMNKKKNEIRYESGSIEDPEINKKVVNVLEGTMPAFSKRDEKYHRLV